MKMKLTSCLDWKFTKLAPVFFRSYFWLYFLKSKFYDSLLISCFKWGSNSSTLQQFLLELFSSSDQSLNKIYFRKQNQCKQIRWIQNKVCEPSQLIIHVILLRRASEKTWDILFFYYKISHDDKKVKNF